MTTEDWRPIPGYPGYLASSAGSIYSERRKRQLRPSVNAYGYQVISAVDELGRKPKVFVHRLVLAAFVGPCPDGMEGCHSDGDRSNNNVDNLRWDTRSGNVRDAIRHGTHPQASKTACKYGHPFDDRNTVLTAGGSRRCRSCHARRSREYRTATAAAA